MKYRMDVDEVGNSDLKASKDPNHRYLSLTGVILGLECVNSTVFPLLEGLKRKYFSSHADDPVILHRKEILNRRPPFAALRASAISMASDEELIALLGMLEFTVITVVIDKLEQTERYKVWRHDPHHDGLRVLLERFALWLERRDAKGDVLAE